MHYKSLLTLDLGSSITSGNDLMDFVVDPAVTTEWYYSPGTTDQARYGEYTDVRLVPVWYGTFQLNPNNTRLGTQNGIYAVNSFGY